MPYASERWIRAWAPGAQKTIIVWEDEEDQKDWARGSACVAPCRCQLLFFLGHGIISESHMPPALPMLFRCLKDAGEQDNR